MLIIIFTDRFSLSFQIVASISNCKPKTCFLDHIYIIAVVAYSDGLIWEDVQLSCQILQSVSF